MGTVVGTVVGTAVGTVVGTVAGILAGTRAGTPAVLMKRMEKFMNEADKAYKDDTSSEPTMVLRRLKIHRFSQRIPKPTRQIPQCASCFASIVFEGEVEHQQK